MNSTFLSKFYTIMKFYYNLLRVSNRINTLETQTNTNNKNMLYHEKKLIESNIH